MSSVHMSEIVNPPLTRDEGGDSVIFPGRVLNLRRSFLSQSQYFRITRKTKDTFIHLTPKLYTWSCMKLQSQQTLLSSCSSRFSTILCAPNTLPHRRSSSAVSPVTGSSSSPENHQCRYALRQRGPSRRTPDTYHSSLKTCSTT